MKPKNSSLMAVLFFMVTLLSFSVNAQTQKDTVSQPNKMKMQKDTAKKNTNPPNPNNYKQQRPNTQPVDTPPHGMMMASIAGLNQAQQPTQTQQSSQMQQPASNAKLSTSDQKFLTDAMSSNNDEIKIAQLAEEKSSNDKVKNVAKILETDHSQMLDELKKIAKDKSLNLAVLDTAHSAMAEKMLVSNKPDDFDAAWIKSMLGDHTITLNSLESASNSVTDADLKNWIQRAIPIVKTHIDKLNQLKEQL